MKTNQDTSWCFSLPPGGRLTVLFKSTSLFVYDNNTEDLVELECDVEAITFVADDVVISISAAVLSDFLDFDIEAMTSMGDGVIAISDESTSDFIDYLKGPPNDHI